MVGKLFSLLSREINSLHEAAFILAFATFGSQLLALLRDRLLATNFGAGRTLDIYYAAFRLPDLVYVSVASFVSVTVLIPFIVRRLESGASDEAKKLLNQVFSVFTVVVLVVTVLLAILAPILAPVFAPGLIGADRDQFVLLTRILLISPIILGISNLLAAVTQSHRQYLAYAFSPLLYNLGIIVGILFFAPHLGSLGIVFGVVIGSILHLLVQLPTLLRIGFLPRPTAKISWPEMLSIIRTSLPRTAALATSQVVQAVMVSLASLLSVGSITVFTFASNLQSVPMALIGISYSVAAFPVLSQLSSQGDHSAFKDQLGSAVRHIMFWSILATFFFIVLRAQIVRVLLGAGEFGWAETRLVAAALALFVVSATAQSLILLFVRACYALGRTWWPLVISLASAAFTIVLTFGLGWLYKESLFWRYFTESLLRVEDVPGTSILMFPLAFSIGSILGLWGLARLLRFDLGPLPASVWRVLRQVTSAGIISGFITYQFLDVLGRLFDLRTFIGVSLQGFAAGLIGLIAAALLLRVLSSRELHEIESVLKKRVWRRTVVLPESPEL